MFRRVSVVLVIVAVVVALAGCESYRGKSPFETSLPSSMFGFRVTDGKLRIWTGAACEGTTYVLLNFGVPGSDEDALQLRTPTYEGGLNPGIEFEFLTLGGPYTGFDVTNALPPGFDWRTAQHLSFDIHGPPFARGNATDFAPVVTEITGHSGEHPKDTYFFPRLGWLGPAEVAARDGKDFMTTCTPDPVKKEDAALGAFGVRVTGGTLRFWTGAPCIGDTGLIITFQPGQADLVLNREALLSEKLEYLTLGGPHPGFTVVHPLPADFDWRRADSVLLQLQFKAIWWSKTTQLAVPIAESSQHPPDTYYFERFGWLDPAEVADRDGSSMHTICGRKS